MQAAAPIKKKEANAMATENKKAEYRTDWISKTYDRINLTVPKGRKEAVKAHAETQGESLNAFINRAILETMERDAAK